MVSCRYEDVSWRYGEDVKKCEDVRCREDEMALGGYFFWVRGFGDWRGGFGWVGFGDVAKRTFYWVVVV